MDTKIPKLRKPTGIIPNPSFPRLNPDLSATIRAHLAEVNKLPLSKDIGNLLTPAIDIRKRAASPEVQSNVLPRAKLRRSRSASDLRMPMKPLKRMQPTLPTIHSKVATKTPSVTSAMRLGITSAISNVKSVSNMKLTNNLKSAAAGKTATTSSSAGANKASGTSIPKTAVKRIPPYDYKARFLDLTEKHRILKSKYEEKLDQASQIQTLTEQYAESQQELLHLRCNANIFNRDLKELKDKIIILESRNEKLTNIVREKEAKLLETEKDRDEKTETAKRLTEESLSLQTDLKELRSEYEFCKEENESKSVDIADFKEKLFLANIERKDLHNMVADLRGNIRVFCRVRPPLSNELNRQLCVINHLDETSLELISSDFNNSKYKGNKSDFSFDHVFHEKTKQNDIFEMVSPLIQSALDGYNVCIFAYGQTGSGKTFTMDGTANQLGVIPRTVELIFDSVKNYKKLGWTYTISATFLEIYNEVFYDLLNPNNRDLEIRMASATNKAEVYVSNVTEETIRDGNHLRQLMQLARMNRATAATTGNERSSRSHAVTQIQLVGTHVEKQELCTGTINLVDLAGSESPKTSQRMEETKNINRSLSELSNVITALVEKHEHVPYRNSKLTHLLKPSLGGNSKTLMIVNIAPFQDCLTESTKSLRFAASVNSCKLSKAKKNRVLNSFNSSNSSTY